MGVCSPRTWRLNCVVWRVSLLASSRKYYPSCEKVGVLVSWIGRWGSDGAGCQAVKNLKRYITGRAREELQVPLSLMPGLNWRYYTLEHTSQIPHLNLFLHMTSETPRCAPVGLHRASFKEEVHVAPTRCSKPVQNLVRENPS